MRTSFTLYVSETRPDSLFDGEKIVFATWKEALVRMWAEAHRETPRRVWVHAGLDGWEINDHMKGKEIPRDISLSSSIHAELAKLNAIDCNETNDRELTVTLKLLPNGCFSVYCPQMRYDGVAFQKDIGQELQHLYFEYQSVVEAGV